MKNTIAEQKTALKEIVNFDSYLSVEGIPDICRMTKEQFDTEIMQGYQDVLEGNVMAVEQAFVEIRKEFTGMRCAQPVEK